MVAGHDQLFGRRHRQNSPPRGRGLVLVIVDVEVDVETGKVDVVRCTVVQDAGKAIHPAYVEGQMQGGTAQGIGWALNEEYVYDAEGRLLNAGLLDYRMPVVNDLPMIDTVIVEVPNPGHPYGVRGVGEASIVPPPCAQLLPRRCTIPHFCNPRSARGSTLLWLQERRLTCCLGRRLVHRRRFSIGSSRRWVAISAAVRP